MQATLDAPPQIVTFGSNWYRAYMAKFSPHPEREAAVLLALVMLVVFANPLISWWLDAKPPWYLPYLLWLTIIVLTGLQAWRTRRPQDRQPDDR